MHSKVLLSHLTLFNLKAQQMPVIPRSFWLLSILVSVLCNAGIRESLRNWGILTISPSFYQQPPHCSRCLKMLYSQLLWESQGLRRFPCCRNLLLCSRGWWGEKCREGGKSSKANPPSLLKTQILPVLTASPGCWRSRMQTHCCWGGVFP